MNRETSCKFQRAFIIVIVCGTWCGRAHPFIKGGPLTDIYNFHSMMFHWGPSDNEGSEHTINHVRYAMELQFIHVKRGFFSPLQAVLLGAKDGVVIVSSFFNVRGFIPLSLSLSLSSPFSLFLSITEETNKRSSQQIKADVFR